jgi:PPK2 family polyphosphate:nucleotide phosphotransferase
MGIVKVTGKHKIKLKDIDANSNGGLTKADAAPRLEQAKARIAELQEKLFAEHKQSLLVVLQAIDTGGKDGTIRSVFSGVNPAGVRVWSFKVPTDWEADHDILWRYHQHTPGRGMINVFNRSYFEEVLVVRVKKLVPKAIWESRYDQINQFEKMLAENGTRVVKIYLHISKDEQRARLQARLDDPAKHWKFSIGDLADREYWDDYQQAFEDAINRCATPESPWLVVPANRKWYRNCVIAEALAKVLEEMDPQWPEEEDGLENVVIPD